VKKAKRKKKPAWRMMRFRIKKEDPNHNLFAAAQRWIHANGGTSVVMGGVEVQDWSDGESRYKVALAVIGKRPEKKT
jgi:hypothetical protein